MIKKNQNGLRLMDKNTTCQTSDHDDTWEVASKHVIKSMQNFKILG